jgi:hypothetical protein
MDQPGELDVGGVLTGDGFIEKMIPEGFAGEFGLPKFLQLGYCRGCAR